MSATISGPWILDFLISVAEEYGGNLSAAPPKKKAAKAQLVKFLTFPDPGDTAPCNIWVQISDKKHIIHARLSQDAVARYLQHPLYAGKLITSHKSALVSLQRVRVAFGRVPSGESKGMSKDATLFLHVDEFELKGSFGEAMWDSPVDIASDKNIRDWIHGLRQDGGASNILKQRKEQAGSNAELTKRMRTTAAESHVQTTMDDMNVKVRVARKSGPPKPRISPCASGTELERPTVSKEALRKASWKRFHARMANYFYPPDEVLEHLFTLCGERLPRSAVHRGSPRRQDSLSHAGSRSPCGGTRLSSSSSPSKSAVSKPRASPIRTPQSSPSRSPSQWSPSVRGSPGRSIKGSSDTEEEPEDAVYGADTDNDDVPDEHVVPNTSSTKLGTQSPKSPKTTVDHNSPSLSMPPPPAQPLPRPPTSSVPYATSSPQPPVCSQRQPSATAERTESLPPSSLPVPVSSLRVPPSPASSPQYPTSTPAWSTSGVRRVPPPQVGTLLRDPDASGEGRVLVENSDTASPGSQRVLSQSQSQSQNEGSQEQGQSQSSQSQRPSKLRNEVGPAQTQAEEDPRKSERPESSNAPESPAAPELEEGSQESAKSRQSLSYKGDSQSQDKSGPAEHAPDAQIEVTTEAEEREAPIAVDGFDEASNIDAEHIQDSAPQPEQIKSSPRSSPMHVDPQPPDALHAAAPTWAAIRATTSPEDEGDSEGDVDELLSDPLAFEQEAPAPPRQTRGRKAKYHAPAKGKERLDSDDERTAAMVERYAKQTNQAAPRPKRSGARESSPAKRPRQSTPAVEEQPQNRTLKRRRKERGNGEQAGPSLPPEADVFTSEGSFREEPPKPSSSKTDVPKQRERAPPASTRPEERHTASADTARRLDGIRPKSPAHDPAIWGAPTFLRKGAAEPDKAAPSRKRAAGASLSGEAEEPAVKKRKTSSAAVPVSRTDAPSKAVHDPSMSMPTSLTTQLHSSKSPAGPTSTLRRPPPPQESVSYSYTDSKGRKHVDLRAVTSRSSSRASREGSKGPRAAQVSHDNVPASTSSKGKAPMRSVKREEVDTLCPSQPFANLSGAKDVSSRNAAQLPPSRSRHVPPPPPGTAVSNSSLRGPRHGQTDATRPLLDEYRTSLQQTRTAGGPPLLGWDDLLEILLETGRARTEARQGASSHGA
ncbi:hypothetical protein L226DRAFT_610663 [Lentinus tigrinus ALCF2SS1-7]|uniref:Telomere replication protein EST3 n=1 Tax=Lentinus tigrinus ALCF2SS1-6 TaxID=1328759 RepID=A0A5C2S2B7_9APHY|nr:hypothetical protein L227DRAFT_577918 [Lentinus tigrinus ALCF2SS1-6]RPD78832.1 hypothetical protein L226DRAFT_610663 [Lentinus tigrinus ALCF2SS1-7]